MPMHEYAGKLKTIERPHLFPLAPPAESKVVKRNQWPNGTAMHSVKITSSSLP